MASVLISNRNAPKPANVAVMNVVRNFSSIPNMSFLITAYVKINPSNNAARTTVVGINGPNAINNVGTSIASLNGLVSIEGDCPRIPTIVNRTRVDEIWSTVFPINPKRQHELLQLDLSFHFL